MYKIQFSNIGEAKRSANMDVSHITLQEVIVLVTCVCQFLSGEQDITLAYVDDMTYMVGGGSKFVGRIKITHH